MKTVRELAALFKIAGRVTLDEPMAAHTSFRIGGPADLYAAPVTMEELQQVCEVCRREDAPFFLLGGGTNILVSDRGVRGVVIDLSRLSGWEADGTLLIALGGTPVSSLAEAALERRLSGLEFAYALPGSVGGAAWMNARCYDREMSDVLELADYLEPAGALSRRAMDRSEWSYKRSPFQDLPGAVVRVGLRLTPGDPVEIEARMRHNREDRERKGHFLFPCAGSIFKNNRSFGEPTGRLIDSLGMKGRQIGAAQVAPFHGNIIVNKGGAAACDVLALIELLEDEVLRRLGLRLEREVVLVGDWQAAR